jgi:hypothetical protein
MSYRHPSGKVLTRIAIEDRFNNQLVLSGTNPEQLLPKGIFFLEVLVLSSGTATIADGKGIAIMTGISGFTQEISPLRCDYGITITGAVLYAKGFVVEGCLSE